jgi:hypothetical protein
LNPSNGAVLTETGGPTLTITDQEAFVVSGQAFDPGLVTLSLDSVSGTAFATATASGAAGAATFSVATSSNTFPLGTHSIVAWETVGGATLQASATVDVLRLP